MYRLFSSRRFHRFSSTTQNFLITQTKSHFVTFSVVAVKQLDKHGLHGSKEFQAEVLSLGQLDHANLVKLVGYCADGDQRLLVYDYISGGSLQDHLHEPKPDREPMDWTTRMQIAYGAAQGL